MGYAGLTLPEGSWWDWDVVEWVPGRLRLGAGWDLSYHHDLEVVFSDPGFVSCPSSFSDPIFRDPTPAELDQLSHTLGLHDTPPVVIAFEADAGGDRPISCLITAGGVEVVTGTVLRYWRADTTADQRFAPWVRRPETN